jgi:plasmid stabilization system protein ParE
MPIKVVYHPEYSYNFTDWAKFRLTYRGGKEFVEEYLKKYSDEEQQTDFERRRDISFCSAHAKQAVNKVKNAIFQRFVDITRIGGSQNYQQSVTTDIDLLGNSLNTFLGKFILPDLLTIGKTYIYVDSPVLDDKSLLGKIGKNPYIYYYPAENVLSWTQGTARDPKEFTSVLLMDRAFEIDPVLNLPKGYVIRYRYMYLKNGKVHVQFYNPVVERPTISVTIPQAIIDLNEDGPEFVLDVPEIPLIPIELTESLLKDIADYQIALTNLESSDISYLLKSNTVIYTEQFDQKLEQMFSRLSDPDGTGTADEAKVAKDKTIHIGHGRGRGYPVGTDRPDFINPSSDPVKISMEKQNQMINAIDRLVDVTLESYAMTGEAKKVDKQGLEAGLSYIGLILEQADRKIAKYYSMYEKVESATVAYPTDYSLRTDEDRKKAADDTAKLKNKVPSKTYQKEISKEVARILLAHKLSVNVLQKIMSEIDDADYLTSEIAELVQAHEAGFVTAETASIAAGFEKGEAEEAKKENAERLAMIAASQTTGIRGVTDQNNEQAKLDKVGKEKRGEGQENGEEA